MDKCGWIKDRRGWNLEAGTIPRIELNSRSGIPPAEPIAERAANEGWIKWGFLL